MLRSTFSTTTMASSTTMPMASTNPNRLNAFMEKPKRYSSEKVPTIDTGTATSGMMEARQVCRNRITTSTTSATDSNSVWTTDLIEALTNCVGSYTIWYSTPSGMFFLVSAIVRRTSSEICTAFDPGAATIATPTPPLLASSDRRTCT